MYFWKTGDLAHSWINLSLRYNWSAHSPAPSFANITILEVPSPCSSAGALPGSLSLSENYNRHGFLLPLAPDLEQVNNSPLDRARRRFSSKRWKAAFHSWAQSLLSNQDFQGYSPSAVVKMIGFGEHQIRWLPARFVSGCRLLFVLDCSAWFPQFPASSRSASTMLVLFGFSTGAPPTVAVFPSTFCRGSFSHGTQAPFSFLAASSSTFACWAGAPSFPRLSAGFTSKSPVHGEPFERGTHETSWQILDPSATVVDS